MDAAATILIEEGDTLVGVAQAALARLCEEVPGAAAMLDLEDAAGEPFVAVATDDLDGHTLAAYLGGNHRADRLRAEVRRTLAPAVSTSLLDRRQAREHAADLGCADGVRRHIAVAPLTGADAQVGTLRLASEWPLSAAAVERLAAVAAQVSVRLANLGFAARGGGRPALTDRQLQVARLVGRGYTNAAIARELGVTEDAIKKHVKVMMAELDVANRAELAVVAGRTAGGEVVDGGAVRPGFQVVRRGAGGS
ncbi:MAG TPA: helix-turn-helix transcriptional regulator [Kofleriaceae bacterium]|nr:helix-turn-helix transcriptional regulator [Kofleriaceae bacterium]